ncbi:hypothetical protein EJ04DRAFT_261667 [Polyplosphaeria fusca]|uniref:Uncharacterized protein n=1 Tax=Polyplosphaeria fusca TaxID=682080 RepID=A0A9P4RAU6_9PLEO|nr:hypothetical protein EJ04DRAFT_261667 [Polyplosphaeria fusca]
MHNNVLQRPSRPLNHCIEHTELALTLLSRRRLCFWIINRILYEKEPVRLSTSQKRAGGRLSTPAVSGTFGSQRMRRPGGQDAHDSGEDTRLSSTGVTPTNGGGIALASVAGGLWSRSRGWVLDEAASRRQGGPSYTRHLEEGKGRKCHSCGDACPSPPASARTPRIRMMQLVASLGEEDMAWSARSERVNLRDEMAVRIIGRSTSRRWCLGM